ncbi:Hypothetical_protein [Hexamita inflata]|uniref:Hypothetical_protein n=1 Tax=Hexamita inflata TaxID=28002 RepID=A0ABP1JAK9_9EUKA
MKEATCHQLHENQQSIRKNVLKTRANVILNQQAPALTFDYRQIYLNQQQLLTTTAVTPKFIKCGTIQKSTSKQINEHRPARPYHTVHQTQSSLDMLKIRPCMALQNNSFKQFCAVQNFSVYFSSLEQEKQLKTQKSAPKAQNEPKKPLIQTETFQIQDQEEIIHQQIRCQSAKINRKCQMCQQKIRIGLKNGSQKFNKQMKVCVGCGQYI